MSKNDQQQDGIHFRSGESPPAFFRLVTFNFLPHATPETAMLSLTAMWDVLHELKAGRIRDLRATRADDPDIVVDSGSLSFLIGYGKRLFDADGREHQLVSADLGNL